MQLSKIGDSDSLFRKYGNTCPKKRTRDGDFFKRILDRLPILNRVRFQINSNRFLLQRHINVNDCLVIPPEDTSKGMLKTTPLLPEGTYFINSPPNGEPDQPYFHWNKYPVPGKAKHSAMACFTATGPGQENRSASRMSICTAVPDIVPTKRLEALSRGRQNLSWQGMNRPHEAGAENRPTGTATQKE